MNETHTISFREAKAQIALAVRRLGDSATLSEWEEKAGKVLEKNLEEPVATILFNLVNAQDLSQQHKKEMYDSFDYRITVDGIELVFNPKTPLMGAIENGASPRSLEESVLTKNYKINKDGYKYKVIPLQSKEPVKGAEITPKMITADYSAEEQFFKEIELLIGDKEKVLSFEEMHTTERNRYYRTEKFVTKVAGRRRGARIYVAAPRANTVNSLSRFITFRTITDDPAKRWRPIPGFPGLKLADQLVQEYTELIKEETQRLIEKFS